MMKSRIINSISTSILGICCISFFLSGCGLSTRKELSVKESETSSYEVVKESESAANTDSSLTTPAYEIINAINVGWNLGNAFDCCVNESQRNLDGTREPSFYETAWGNPVISEDLIDLVADSGFNTIRIPVTWYYNTYEDTDGCLHIQDIWKQRVKEVVDYALSKDLYVILDSHHDAPIFYAYANEVDQVKKNVTEVWTEIAKTFIAYDNHLLFEGFNELNDATDSWKINETNIEINNELNQTFVDCVRKTGGNNASRVLLVGTYLNSFDSAVLDGFVLPKDTANQSLIVSIHYYGTYFDQEIESSFSSLEEFSVSISTPVLITEFGTQVEKDSIENRAIHASNYVARAKGHHIKCIWWDDGNKFRLFDRKEQLSEYPEVILGLMNPEAHTTNYTKNQDFTSMDSFVFGSVSAENGSIVETDDGSLSLVDQGDGFSVTPGKQYTVTLTISGEGDGMRMKQIAFYSGDNTFMESVPFSDVTSATITAPAGAAYMKLSFHNPWGYRSVKDYESMLKSGGLVINLKEFE